MIPANVWEQSSASDSIKNGSNGHHDNGNDLEIDLDELDEYYDEIANCRALCEMPVDLGLIFMTYQEFQASIGR